MKVRITNLPKPPECQGGERQPRNLRLWKKIKGMEIKVEPAYPLKSHWKCGTDKIYKIVDPEYYRRVGSTDLQPLFCCKHAVVEVEETSETP